MESAPPSPAVFMQIQRLAVTNELIRVTIGFESEVPFPCLVRSELGFAYSALLLAG